MAITKRIVCLANSRKDRGALCRRDGMGCAALVGAPGQ